MKSFLYSLWEIFEVVLVAVVAVFIIRNFFVQPFLVSGSSMEPSFSSSDYLVVDEMTYNFRAPQRGDVIVFHYPGNESVYYIKRIIGLSGETIKIAGGEITIFNPEHPNGFILDESYLPLGIKTSGHESVILKPNEYFVLGDNRNYSFDSRSWGSLTKKEIVGLVRLRLWPISKVMAIGKPTY